MVISTVLDVPSTLVTLTGFVNSISDIQIVIGTVIGEGPVTGGIDIEITDGAVDSVYSERAVCVNGIGAGQRAGSRDRCIRFGQRLGITGDRSGIVGAVDGDLNGTRRTVDS